MRPVALAATLGVVLLHGVFLIELWSTHTPLPLSVSVMELLWAHNQRPIFHSLGCILLIAGLLTAAGWLQRGDHRIVLALSWVAAVLTAVVTDGARLALMGRIVWEQL